MTSDWYRKESEYIIQERVDEYRCIYRQTIYLFGWKVTSWDTVTYDPEKNRTHADTVFSTKSQAIETGNKYRAYHKKKRTPWSDTKIRA